MLQNAGSGTSKPGVSNSSKGSVASQEARSKRSSKSSNNEKSNKRTKTNRALDMEDGPAPDKNSSNSRGTRKSQAARSNNEVVPRRMVSNKCSFQIAMY